MVSTRTDEDVTRDLMDALSKMDLEQKNTFDRIITEAMPGVISAYPDSRVVGEAGSKVLFQDASGGTNKTFTLKILHDILRLRKREVITVPTSAVAPSLLDCGTTSLSEFKIRVPCGPEANCNAAIDSELAKFLCQVEDILWGEIVMCAVYGFEVVHHMLRDINRMYKSFGGKIAVFCGEFRQVVPIVRGGSSGMIVERCVTSSPLFQVV